MAANTCDTVNSSDTDTIETDAEAAERAHLHFLSQLRDMDESDILPEPIDPQHVDRLVAEACELKGRKPLSCSVCAEWQPARTARSLFIKPLSELPAAFWEILKPPSGNNALGPLAIQQYNLLNASLYDQVSYAGWAPFLDESALNRQHVTTLLLAWRGVQLATCSGERDLCVP